MKKTVTFFLLLCAALIAKAQLSNDQFLVLELSLNMAEMEANHHLNDDDMPVLVIADNGVLPEGTSLQWFENPVEFKTLQEIEDENIGAYIQFDAFGVTSDTDAHSTFSLHYANGEGRSYQLGIGFLAGYWYVKQREINYF